jgi:hypothetical protein
MGENALSGALNITDIIPSERGFMARRQSHPHLDAHRDIPNSLPIAPRLVTIKQAAA